jgi:dTDP-4-dehydrorhamnose reductase
MGLEKKKVLIIGSRGRLGLDLFRLLDKSCLECHAPTSKELDITNSGDIFSYVYKIKPDIIVNSAGLTNVDRCEKEREKAIRVNSIGQRFIAVACREVGAKCVYFSTDYIFDGAKKRPYEEDDITNPLSFYGKTKLMGEAYTQMETENYLIVRSSWFFSRRGSNFINAILKAMKEQQEMKVIYDQVSCPTFTEDLAMAVKRLMDSGSTGIFNITNGGCCTWIEFGQKILDFYRSKLSLIPIPLEDMVRVATRPHYSVLNNSKLKRITDIILPNWQSGLSRALEGGTNGK